MPRFHTRCITFIRPFKDGIRSIMTLLSGREESAPSRFLFLSPVNVVPSLNGLANQSPGMPQSAWRNVTGPERIVRNRLGSVAEGVNGEAADGEPPAVFAEPRGVDSV